MSWGSKLFVVLLSHVGMDEEPFEQPRSILYEEYEAGRVTADQIRVHFHDVNRSQTGAQYPGFRLIVQQTNTARDSSQLMAEQLNSLEIMRRFVHSLTTPFTE